MHTVVQVEMQMKIMLRNQIELQARCNLKFCHPPSLTFYRAHYKMWTPPIIYLWRFHHQILNYNRVPIVNAFFHHHPSPDSTDSISLKTLYIPKSVFQMSHFLSNHDILPFYILRIFSWAMWNSTQKWIQYSYWIFVFQPLLLLIEWQADNYNHLRDMLATWNAALQLQCSCNSLKKV